MSSNTYGQITPQALMAAKRKLLDPVPFPPRAYGWTRVYSLVPSASGPFGRITNTTWVPMWETHSRRRYYGPLTVTYQRRMKKWIVFLRDTSDTPLIRVGQVGQCDTLEQAKALAEATYALGEDHD